MSLNSNQSDLHPLNSEVFENVTALFVRVSEKRIPFWNHPYLQCGYPSSYANAVSDKISSLVDIDKDVLKSSTTFICQACSSQYDLPVILPRVGRKRENELFLNARRMCTHSLQQVECGLKQIPSNVDLIYLEELIYYRTSGLESMISKTSSRIYDLVVNIPNLRRLELVAPAKESLDVLLAKSSPIMELAIRSMGTECLGLLKQFVFSKKCNLRLLDLSVSREDEEDSSSDGEDYSAEGVILTRENPTSEVGKSRFLRLATFFLNTEDLRKIYVVDTTYRKAPYFELNNRVMTYNEQPCGECISFFDTEESVLSPTSSFRQVAVARFDSFCCSDDHIHNTVPDILPTDKYLLYYNEFEPADEPIVTRRRPADENFSPAGALIREAKERGPKMKATGLFFNLHDVRVVLTPQSEDPASEFPLPRVEVFDHSCLTCGIAANKRLPSFLIPLIREVETLSISNRSPLARTMDYTSVLIDIFKFAPNIKIFDTSSSLLVSLAKSRRLTPVLKLGVNVRVLHLRVFLGYARTFVNNFGTILRGAEEAFPKLRHFCLHSEFHYGDVVDEEIDIESLKNAAQVLHDLQEKNRNIVVSSPRDIFGSWLEVLNIIKLD